MTNQWLRDLYDCLKDRSETANILPSFAAVLRAKREGRITAKSSWEYGSLTIHGEDGGTWKWSFAKEG